FFFSSRRRHTRSYGDWSSDVCSSDLSGEARIDRLVPKNPPPVVVVPDDPQVSRDIEQQVQQCCGEEDEHGPAEIQGENGHNRNRDRKSTRLNSSHRTISYAVFCLKKK